MAYDAFLELKGIDGESTAKGMEKKFEIFSFSFGASNPVTVGSGATGIGAGKVSVSGLNVMKKSESASAKLFSNCCTGEHISEGTLTLRKAGGDQSPYLVYKMTDVMIESIQWSGSTGGDDTPTESLSIAFAKIEITYSKQDNKGKVSVAGNASWDLTKVSK